MPEETVSLSFVNSVEVYELMIGTLHPWQQLQSISWKWHQETRCENVSKPLVKERKLDFYLIIMNLSIRLFLF